MSIHSREEMPVRFEQEGLGEQRAEEAGDMRITFERWSAGDYSEMFADQPDGMCQEEHWGYVLKGKMKIRAKDGSEEELREGQAYYIPAGHLPLLDQDVELVEFTRTS